MDYAILIQTSVTLMFYWVVKDEIM